MEQIHIAEKDIPTREIILKFPLMGKQGCVESVQVDIQEIIKNKRKPEVIPNKLKEWLEKCGCLEVQPVTVIIDGESWPGCRYKKEFEYAAGMGCVSDGRHKAGEKYTEEFIYCLGDQPRPESCKRLKRNKYIENICFPFEGLDWYLAGHMQLKDIKPEFAEFHPFGINFLLKPWDIPNETIDRYEEKPYDRFPMTVIKL